jgi:hypothetical protein
MIGNAARHGVYGLNGAYFAYGNAILNAFFPESVVTANYFSGGSATRYPVGNLFAGAFTDQFANPPSDFTVREGSALKQAAPGGRDIGVDYASLATRVANVVAGTAAPKRPPTPANLYIIPR